MQTSITILLVNTLILIISFNRIQSKWSSFYGGQNADTKSFVFSSIATNRSYITKICVGTSPILHNIQTTFNNNDSSGFHGANTTNNDSISCYSVHPSHCFVSVTLFVAGCDHCSIHVLQFRSSAGEWGPYWGQHVDNSGTTYTVEANTDECISKINIEYDTNNIRRIRFYFESFNTSAPTTAIPSNSPTNNPTNPTISPTSGCYGTHTGLSWNDASAFCQSVCDSNLSSIHSLSDFNVIAAVLSSNNMDDKAWIGLNGYYILDEYIWSDSTPMDYGTIFGLYPWAQSEPNGNINDRCVAMHSVYGWYDEDCDKLYPFICGLAIQLSLTPTTSYPSFHPTYNPTFYPTQTPSNIPTSAPFSSTEGELQVSATIQLYTISVEDKEPKDDEPTNDSFIVFVSIGGSIICCAICVIVCFIIYKIRAERENSADAAAKQRPQISASPYVDINYNDKDIGIGSSLVELQSSPSDKLRNIQKSLAKMDPFKPSAERMDYKERVRNSSFMSDEGQIARKYSDLEANDTLAERRGAKGAPATIGGLNMEIIYEDDNEEHKKVKKWLQEKYELEDYIEGFISNGYESIDIIKDMESKLELAEIGINIKEHQTKLWAEIKKLKERTNDSYNTIQ